MVSSDDAKLYIYEGTTLLWLCDLLNNAISISRCFLKNLPGGLAFLSSDGILSVSYLGTEPDLNSNTGSMMNDVVDPEQVQSELETVEEALQTILENKEEPDSQHIDQIIKIKADVGKPVQNLKEFTNDNKALHLLMCPVVIIMTCEDPAIIQSVQITYECRPPFSCSDPIVCLDNINGTEIIEAQVFIANNMDISDTKVKVMFTFTDSAGKIVVFSKDVLLPISLYCSPTDSILDHQLSLQIQSNHSCLDFNKIFTDFSEEDLQNYESSLSTVTFVYRNTKKTVTMKANERTYTLEANDFSDIIAILDHFVFRLKDHYARMGIKDFKYRIKYDKDVIKQIIHTFLKTIEAHAKERIKLKKNEDDLNILQRQFTVIQKKLLVQYGSLPPGDCEPLEFLMRDTHKRLINLVHEIIECRENVNRAGGSVTAVGQLTIYILKQITTDDFKLKLIEEMLSLSTLYELYQEWEEAVTQALTYILNHVLQKSEKDKEKLAPVTEQGILSHINLKRFLKQIRIVLDNVLTNATDLETDKPKETVVRIEEFVEVL